MNIKANDDTNLLKWTGNMLLNIIATLGLLILDYLGILAMARIGNGAKAKWRALIDDTRSHHA